jgi:uncharacterized membrane protein
MGSKKKKPPAIAPASRWPIDAARVLLGVAAAMAAYLSWNALTGGALPGCGPASGCDKVLQSRWAYWLGIPVGVPALAAYLGLLAATFFVRGSAPAERQRRTWLAIVALSVLIIGAALWFAGLQVFLLKSYCKFCLTAHASGLLASLLLLRAIPLESASGKAGQAARGATLPRSLGARLALLGSVGVVALVAGQALVNPPQQLVKTVGMQSAATATTTATATAPPTQVKAAETPTATQPLAAGEAKSPGPPGKLPGRELILHGGKFQLKLNELPMIGSVEAPHVIVSLFDYTCHYCHDLHGLLVEAQRRFGNQLAIVSLPMPLDAACNHLMTRTPGAHQNACEYAALGLAVWRAQPGAFAQFDTWIFTPPSPLPVPQVKQYAEQLVGRENLERALADGWVKQQIQTDVAIYDTNSRALNGDSRMPQLIIGSSISSGPVPRIENLYQMLSEQFGLKANP